MLLKTCIAPVGCNSSFAKRHFLFLWLHLMVKEEEIITRKIFQFFFLPAIVTDCSWSHSVRSTFSILFFNQQNCKKNLKGIRLSTGQGTPQQQSAGDNQYWILPSLFITWIVEVWFHKFFSTSCQMYSRYWCWVKVMLFLNMRDEFEFDVNKRFDIWHWICMMFGADLEVGQQCTMGKSKQVSDL